MDKILRHITLEDVTGRLFTKIPSLSGGTIVDMEDDSYNDWGKLPYDVIIEKYDNGWIANDSLYTIAYSETYDYRELSALTDTLPLVETQTYDEEGNVDQRYMVLRYKNLCYNFAFIKDFARKSRYYRPCKKGNSYYWSEISDYVWESLGVNTEDIVAATTDKLFCEQINFIVSDLPSDSEVEDYMSSGCTGLCVNTETEAFIRTFKEKINAQILFFMTKALIEYKYSIEDGFFSKPFIPLNLFISSMCTDIGEYEPILTKWNPNMRYYIDEEVWYDGDDNIPAGVYRLSNGGTGLVDVCRINRLVYEANEGKDGYHEVVTSDGTTYYTCDKPYYKGHFNTTTRETEFDELVDGVPAHWVPTEEQISGGIDGYSIENIDGTPSRLSELMIRRDIWDNDGNELPFMLTLPVIEDGEGHIIQTSGVTSNTYLPYRFNSYYQSLNIKMNTATIYWINEDEELISASVTPCHEAQMDEDDNPKDFYTDRKTIKGLINNSRIKNGFIEFSYRYFLSSGSTDDYVDISETHPFTLNEEIVANVNIEQQYSSTGYTQYNFKEILADAEYYYLPPAEEQYEGKVFRYLGPNVTGYITNGLYVVGRSDEMWYWYDYPVDGTILSLNGASYDNLGKKYRYEDASVPEKNNRVYQVCPEFDYVNIDYSKTYHLIDGKMVEDGQPTTNATKKNKVSKVQGVRVFKRPSSTNAVNSKQTSTVFIERGTSAAIERHNVLGSIKNFTDLENYRGDYFKVKE